MDSATAADVRAGVSERGADGLGRQVDRRHAAISGIVDALGELTHADDDGSAGVDRHYRPPDKC